MNLEITWAQPANIRIAILATRRLTVLSAIVPPEKLNMEKSMEMSFLSHAL